MSHTLTALVGGAVIDGTDADPIADGTVVIEGGKISHVGPSPRVTVPPEADVVDVRGMTVLPGLIDLHVHMCQFPGHHDQTWPPTAETLLVLHGARHAERLLRAGFTTVRDNFNFHGDTGALSLRHAAYTGLIFNPRIIASGYAGMTGSISDMRIPPLVQRPPGYVADGPLRQSYGRSTYRLSTRTRTPTT